MGGWSLDKKIISIYMGNPDNSNHAELELPATPWEMVDAMDRLRLSEGQEPYWQVEDMGRYEFLAPHLDGYDLYQFNALAEKLRTFGDVDAVAFEGLVQMELNKLYQNNGGDLTLRRVLDLAYSVDCCHVVPGMQSYDGRYHETNKRWSRTIFVPEDGGHRHTFLINSHPAILDGFVSNYRAELAKLHLFGAEHCEPNSGEQDFTGRVLVLSPDTLRESCWQPENQLWLASGGFDCRPHARGRSVFCTCLGDGETTRWNRSEFLGIIRDECLPDWAAEKLAELRQNHDASTMGEMTM